MAGNGEEATPITGEMEEECSQASGENSPSEEILRKNLHNELASPASRERSPYETRPRPAIKGKSKLRGGTASGLAKPVNDRRGQVKTGKARQMQSNTGIARQRPANAGEVRQ